VPCVAPRGKNRKVTSVNDNRGVLVVSEDTIIKGSIRNGRQVEIHGYVEGEVASEALLIHRGGRLYGTIRTDSAEVHGEMQGEVFVKNLIAIGGSGSVTGKVQYGQLAIEHGGNLSAEVRNVPPALLGDFQIEVTRGQSVAITLQDINAVDPDDAAKDLVFTIAHPIRGFVALNATPGQPVTRFTQADLQEGRVLFQHDGSGGAVAGFDVRVTDHTGASSGQPRIVKVDVRG
jgi:cytoskeletal protein CcmA (bactofilin family)